MAHIFVNNTVNLWVSAIKRDYARFVMQKLYPQLFTSLDELSLCSVTAVGNLPLVNGNS
jgi:hypothetical protein